MPRGISKALRGAALGCVLCLSATGCAMETIWKPLTGDDSCRDDGARLPVSGLCQGAAVAYLSNDGAPEPALPEGCEWRLRETAMPAGDVLLYRAAACGETVSKLELRGGAHMGALHLTVSALGTDLAEANPVITLVSAEADAPRAGALSLARETTGDRTEAALCAARDLDFEDAPLGAFVIDVVRAPAQSKAKKAKPKRKAKRAPRSACGPFGYNEAGGGYWRVFQGFAWFIGPQAAPDVDPGSLTLLSREGAGGWMFTEAE